MTFADRLNALSDFVLHTGDINNYGQLRMKGYKNSAEELRECLTLQLKNWTPGPQELVNSRTISLAKEESVLGDHDRDELKITLKIFLSKVDFSQVRRCLDAVFDQLNIDSVEQLIVAFPPFELNLDATATEEEEAAAWLEKVKPVWTELEKLVAEKQAVSLGVADLDVEQLKALYEWADDHKPCIDHYNIDGCCSTGELQVPPELQEYARAKDIQLLTHNDPKEFSASSQFEQICQVPEQCRLGLQAACCSAFSPTWAARYSVMVRRRSVITSKGYLVQFERAP